MAQNRSGQGFAALPSQEQRRIAAMGGRASHESGHGHEWTAEEAQEYGRRGGLASHHHERAAFHHETAAHHHQRAASHHESGNRSRAKLHAQSAYEHERRAGDHAELASRHSGQDEDDRDSSFNRERDPQGRIQSGNEERQGGYREAGSDYRADTADRNSDDDNRRNSGNNDRNSGRNDDNDVEPRRAGDNGNSDRRYDQDSGVVNGRSEYNGTARENS